MRRNTNLRLLPVAILSSVVAEPGSTQTRTAADGPWAGWAQCQRTAQGQGYANQQTHTWVLTGTTPTAEGAFRLYPATWTVTGQGSRQRVMGDGRTVVEQWTTAGPPRPAPISVWIRGPMRRSASPPDTPSCGARGRSPEPASPVRRRARRRIRPRRSATTCTNGPSRRSRTFPPRARPSGSPGPRPSNGSIAPGQPPGTSLTEACSWRFVQGGDGDLLPPNLKQLRSRRDRYAFIERHPKCRQVRGNDPGPTEHNHGSTPKRLRLSRTLSPDVISGSWGATYQPAAPAGFTARHLGGWIRSPSNGRRLPARAVPNRGDPCAGRALTVECPTDGIKLIQRVGSWKVPANLSSNVPSSPQVSYSMRRVEDGVRYPPTPPRRDRAEPLARGPSGRRFLTSRSRHDDPGTEYLGVAWPT